MYTRIMAAVDGSPVSNHALAHAVALAREQHAKLHIVHVLESLGVLWPDVNSASELDLLTVQRERGEALLGDAVRTARRDGALTVSSDLLEADIVGKRIPEILADQAAEFEADLVVIGSHGYRGLSRLFLGSVAEGVARLCAAPVLIVHAPPAAA